VPIGRAAVSEEKPMLTLVMILSIIGLSFGANGF